jgi:hypothetical protein
MESFASSELNRIPGGLGYLHPFGLSVSRQIPEVDPLKKIRFLWGLLKPFERNNFIKKYASEIY